MHIDFTREPPTDIFRDRPRHIRISAALLALVVCGMLLMAYGFFGAGPHGEYLETAALTLFVAPALVFAYFGAKLKDYKRLGPNEKKELAALGGRHPEIAAYCAKVAALGREPVHAEYEAAKEWAEDRK